MASKDESEMLNEWALNEENDDRGEEQLSKQEDGDFVPHEGKEKEDNSFLYASPPTNELSKGCGRQESHPTHRPSHLHLHQIHYEREAVEKRNEGERYDKSNICDAEVVAEQRLNRVGTIEALSGAGRSSDTICDSGSQGSGNSIHCTGQSRHQNDASHYGSSGTDSTGRWSGGFFRLMSWASRMTSRVNGEVGGGGGRSDKGSSDLTDALVSSGSCRHNDDCIGNQGDNECPERIHRNATDYRSNRGRSEVVGDVSFNNIVASNSTARTALPYPLSMSLTSASSPCRASTMSSLSPPPPTHFALSPSTESSSTPLSLPLLRKAREGISDNKPIKGQTMSDDPNTPLDDAMGGRGRSGTDGLTGDALDGTTATLAGVVGDSLEYSGMRPSISSDGARSRTSETSPSGDGSKIDASQNRLSGWLFRRFQSNSSIGNPESVDDYGSGPACNVRNRSTSSVVTSEGEFSAPGRLSAVLESNAVPYGSQLVSAFPSPGSSTIPATSSPLAPSLSLRPETTCLIDEVARIPTKNGNETSKFGNGCPIYREEEGGRGVAHDRNVADTIHLGQRAGISLVRGFSEGLGILAHSREINQFSSSMRRAVTIDGVNLKNYGFNDWSDDEDDDEADLDLDFVGFVNERIASSAAFEKLKEHRHRRPSDRRMRWRERDEVWGREEGNASASTESSPICHAQRHTLLVDEESAIRGIRDDTTKAKSHDSRVDIRRGDDGPVGADGSRKCEQRGVSILTDFRASSPSCASSVVNDNTERAISDFLGGEKSGVRDDNPRSGRRIVDNAIGSDIATGRSFRMNKDSVRADGGGIFDSGENEHRKREMEGQIEEIRNFRQREKKQAEAKKRVVEKTGAGHDGYSFDDGEVGDDLVLRGDERIIHVTSETRDAVNDFCWPTGHETGGSSNGSYSDKGAGDFIPVAGTSVMINRMMRSGMAPTLTDDDTPAASIANILIPHGVDEDYHQDQQHALSSASSRTLRAILPQDRRKQANRKQTVMTIMKSFLGTGALFLPKAFLNGGLIPSILVMLLTFATSVYCMKLLVDCCQRGRETYGEIGYSACGCMGRFLVEFSLVFSQLGFCAVYGIFVASNIRDVVLSLAYCDVAWSIAISAIVLLQFPIYVPLSWVRRIKYFGPVVFFADISIIGGIFIIFCFVAGELHVNGVKTVELINTTSWPLMIGSCVYLWEGIGLLLPIRSSMREEIKSDFPKILLLSLLAILAVYLSYSILSLFAFGSKTSSVILSNLPDSPWIYAVQIMYCSAVVATYPLMLFPAAQVLERHAVAMLTSSPHITFTPFRRKWMKNALRASLVATTLIAAYVGLEELDNFVALIGSTCCVPLAFIYPALFHFLLAGNNESKTFDKILDLVIIFVGIAIVLITSYQSLALWHPTEILTRCEIVPSRPIPTPSVKLSD